MFNMKSWDGETDEDQVLISVVLAGEDELSIVREADDVCHPGDECFGRYISREELIRRLSPPEGAMERVLQWIVDQDMTIATIYQDRIIVVLATLDVLVRTFGRRAARWLKDSSTDAPVTWPLPVEVRGDIAAIQGRDPIATKKVLELADSEVAQSPEEGAVLEGSGGLVRVEVAPADSAGSSLSDLVVADVPDRGWRPEQVRAMYDFPDPSELNGEGETIALMVLGVQIVPEILRQFWKALGVERTGDVVVHNAGYLSEEDNASSVEQLEAYMTAQWIGAMAPGARVVIYSLNPEVLPDIFTAVLGLALFDKEDSPSVLATSWTTPEQRYHASFGLQTFDVLMDAAALVGLSVVSASGDWGVCDGLPRGRGSLHTPVGYAVWPEATFPASAQRVLGVGGTMVQYHNPRTEVIWSGPLPPYAEIRQGIPLTTLATSGGFSEMVPIPDYQKQAVSIMRPFSRGTHLPGVVPFGRGIPDVSLAASGPAVLREDMSETSNLGYLALTPDGWVDFAGGTSVAAPIWAAILALVNQALVREGLPRVGQPHRLLYTLAGKRDSKAFRPVTIGQSNVRLHVTTWDNRDFDYVLPGFEGHSGRPGTRPPYAAADLWNPATGLGVPQVSALVEESVADMRDVVGTRGCA